MCIDNYVFIETHWILREKAVIHIQVAGPRNLRTFLMQIRLFEVAKSLPKFSIGGLLAMAPSLIRGFEGKFG